MRDGCGPQTFLVWVYWIYAPIVLAQEEEQR